MLHPREAAAPHPQRLLRISAGERQHHTVPQPAPRPPAPPAHSCAPGQSQRGL